MGGQPAGRLENIRENSMYFHGLMYCMSLVQLEMGLDCRVEGIMHSYVPTAERIRDTVIHEMCHAANWLIDGTRRAGHGRLWKAWLE